MAVIRAIEVIRRFDDAELSLCLLLNRVCTRRPMRQFFGTVSRLGDGIFWYALIVALPFLYGAGHLPALQMTITGLIGVALYKALKHTLVRERPFINCDRIALEITPLDRYSFPSGHTLHAVSFTTMTLNYFPELGVLLVPFALLIAASRVILGLHYPTDVLAGAVLGFGLANASLSLVPIPEASDCGTSRVTISVVTCPVNGGTESRASAMLVAAKSARTIAKAPRFDAGAGR